MERSVEEIAAKLAALDLWKAAEPFRWAIKPRGVATPYFCVVQTNLVAPLKARLLLLEGWQTFHDFVRHGVDPNYGFYLSTIEMPHFELLVTVDGTARLFRHDPGYVPVEPQGPRRDLCARILWEVFGFLLRLESEPKLPMRYAGEQSVFARLEGADGAWSDVPLAIPEARPHVEKVLFPKDLLVRAKDLPFDAASQLDVDLTLLPGIMTREARPRCAYRLAAVDPKTSERVIFELTSVVPDLGLRGIWEGMPPRLLERLVSRGRIPGEIRVRSQRVFRLLRPLCLDLPFKLSLHDRLPSLEAVPPPAAPPAAPPVPAP